MSINIMMRLGLQLVGSNADLAPVKDESDDSSPGEGGGEGEENEDSEEEESEGSGSGSSDDESDEDEDDAEGEGSGSEDDEDDTDEESDGSGSDEDDDSDEEGDDDADSDEDDDDGESDDGESDEDGKDGESDSSESDSDPSEQDDPSEGGVGGSDDFADSVLDGLESEDLNVKSSNEALKEGTEGCRDQNVLPDEQVWRPFTTNADTVYRPEITPDAEAKIAKAQKVVSKIVASLRAQFQNKYLRARTPEVKHGVRRGQDLSERRLVESMIEIRSGVAPSRPFTKMKKADDESLAIAVVGDESGSMYGARAKNAALAMLAVAEAFDSLGSPIMCCGIRDGNDYTPPQSGTVENNSDYHRFQSVTVDLFKDWNEPLRNCRARFAGYQATGGTPLSDGIQYALEAMSTRQERHRIILVMTDGQPSDGRVVARQIRLAKEAGITIIGIGIGYGTDFVTELFDTGIVLHDIEQLPITLVKTVDSIVFPKQGGKKVALDSSTGLRAPPRGF